MNIHFNLFKTLNRYTKRILDFLRRLACILQIYQDLNEISNVEQKIVSIVLIFLSSFNSVNIRLVMIIYLTTAYETLFLFFSIGDKVGE